MKTNITTKRKAYSYIRFSTLEQEKGHSLQRQKEASEQYAKENNLELDKQNRFKDEGISAFHGKHAKTGDLGRFLKLVNEGRIEPNSVLIVENLDRLSRQQPIEALQKFISIINAGITLVTLSDGQQYTIESLNNNISQLYLSIGEMVRANKESERKSELLSAAWKQKRTDAENGLKKMTNRCPAWLRLNKDKSKYVKKTKVCKAIKEIYRLKLSGYGAASIERKMNLSETFWKPPKRGKHIIGGWRKSYIIKILYNKAVTGVYQPHKMIDGKRAPVGNPIPDYYPQIILEKMFYQVQNIRAMNKVKGLTGGYGGGKTGKASNLFTHIAKCGRCGSPMHYINKGTGVKGGKYLQCSTSSRKLTDGDGHLICDAKAIRYNEFEKLIFDNLEELNLADILPNSNEIQVQQKSINQQIVANQARLIEAVSGIENLTDSIASTKERKVRETLEIRLKQVLDEKDKIISGINNLSKESISLDKEIKQFKSNLKTTKEIYQLLSLAKDNEERIDIRLKLRLELRNIIKSIQIYPLKEKYKYVKDMGDVEQGLIKIMASKYIDHVRITFNGNKNVRVLYLARYALPKELS